MKDITLVSKNIIVNFTCGIWCGLISLAFIPFITHLLGIEAYGLIGFYTSLTLLLAVFDFGLTSTVNRELARLSTRPDSNNEARNLVKTFEIIVAGIGILIGITIISLAPFIARHWINSTTMSTTHVEILIKIMGLSLAFQWPASLYAGALQGLQHQVLLNGVRVIITTLLYGGAFIVLWFISPTIQAFFYWQLCIGALNTLILAMSLWKSLPKGNFESTFNKGLLRKNLRFAAGMTGISILITILTQLDKIILSKMLTLQFFGYYTLAFSLANILVQLVSPISAALFPRFSQMAAMGEDGKLSSLYHKGCQLVTIIVLPVAGTLAVFSKPILSLWLGDPITINNTYFLLTSLIVGTAINTLLVLPFTLQLSYGWTMLSICKCTVGIILLVPLIIWLIRFYGAFGAAMAGIILNLGGVLIEIPIMHQRLLKQEKWNWYLFDVAIPVIITCAVVLLSKIAMPISLPVHLEILWIILTYSFCLFLLVGTLPLTRGVMSSIFLRK